MAQLVAFPLAEPEIQVQTLPGANWHELNLLNVSCIVAYIKVHGNEMFFRKIISSKRTK